VAKEIIMSTIKRQGNKVYIDGVRRIAWDTGEMCEFAASLVSALDCLGERVPYHAVMGASGAAFRFTINPEQWDFGNYSIRNIAADANEPVRRAFAATGYACELRAKGTRQEDVTAIMDSIDRGFPVLAYSVVGPSDYCIITGYDDGGEVLMGWSTYQDIRDDHNIPHDATGYFRKPGWHDNLRGYVLIGEKGDIPPARAVTLDALRWAAHLMRTPSAGHLCTGLAALKLWADEMVDERYFAGLDQGALGWRYVSATINITMLRDHTSAEPFLRQAAEVVPDFQPELSSAADCYARMRVLRDRMDDVIDDRFTEKAMKAFGDPDARKAFAGLILQIRDVEAEALAHVEHLLARCDA
jgi:hypothetical protein